MIHEDVHGAGSGGLGLSHSVHVGAEAETVSEKEDVSVTGGVRGRGPK